MRNLDEINAAAKSTRFAFMVSLVIPIIMGWGAWALAAGAAPRLPFQQNRLEILGLGISGIAITMLPISYLFKWNWETKYFGAGLLPFASGSILGIYPILCITLYSSLPISIRLALIFFHFALIIRWCYRFVAIYRTIYRNEHLFQYIYNEDSSAVYYSQQADKNVVNKLLKFNQFPSARFVTLSLLAAFSLIPFNTPLSRVIGLPFTHIFLAVAATPLNLMFLGLGTKMWLVYYLYPMKIKKKNQKPVYVDISSKPPMPMPDV